MMVFIFCVVFVTDWGRKSPGFLHLIYNCNRNLILLVLCCHGYKFSDFNRSVQAFSLHKVMGNSSQHCNNKNPALLSCFKRIIYQTSESTINSDFHNLLFSFSFSCWGSRVLGHWASVVVESGLNSCGSWTLEHRLNRCGAQVYLFRNI